MSLQSLLRGVSQGIRRDNGGGQVDKAYRFCEDGVRGMCDHCPVRWERHRCPLTESQYVERWTAMHLREIVEDRYEWADKAMVQIGQWSNPGMFLVFLAAYEAAIEGGDDMEWWRSHLEVIISLWRGAGWLDRFAGEARQRHADKPASTEYRDVTETVDAILALADGQKIIEEVSIQ